MKDPREMWLTKYQEQLADALEELATREHALSFLIRDAVAHGRKIRSVLALNLLSWKGWCVPRDQEQTMFDDLARVELLHSASCIIDDIIDGDTVRRGLPSFHVRNAECAATISPNCKRGCWHTALTIKLALTLMKSKKRSESHTPGHTSPSNARIP